MNTRNIFGIALAATLFSSTAFAADVVVPEVIPVFSWTGAYVGLNVGYGGGKAKHPFDVTNAGVTFLNGSVDFTSSGFLGGVQAGYNYQIDQWVVGVETDFQGSGIKGEGSISLNAGGLSIDAKAGTKLDWYGTVRARAGILATDRFLVYATGGLAYGRTKSYIDADLGGGSSFNVSKSKTKAGWTVGAGAEFAVTDHVTFKTEYAYTDLGKANLFNEDLGGATLNLDRKMNFHSIKVGINYKF